MGNRGGNTGLVRRRTAKDFERRRRAKWVEWGIYRRTLEGGREDYVVRLLREDALRAVTPLERSERGETCACEEDYDPVLRAHCRL